MIFVMIIGSDEKMIDKDAEKMTSIRIRMTMMIIKL